LGAVGQLYVGRSVRYFVVCVAAPNYHTGAAPPTTVEESSEEGLTVLNPPVELADPVR